jgi:hypothetical protein
MVKLLLDNGANPNAVSRDNYSSAVSPLHGAVNNNAIAKLLIEKGADVKAINDFDGNTPLHFAKDKDIAQLLIEKGADVKAKNRYGETPLHFKSMVGYKDIAQLLIEKGADFEVTANNGMTPLHTACSFGQKEIVELLINFGADVTVATKEGMTPLHFANSKGHIEVIQYLLDITAEVCGKNKNEDHAWVGCKCTRCGIEKPHIWIDDRCSVCGVPSPFPKARRTLSSNSGSILLYYWDMERRDFAYSLLSTEFSSHISHIERRNVTNRKVEYMYWIVLNEQAYSSGLQDFLGKANCYYSETQYVDYWKVTQDSTPC